MNLSLHRVGGRTTPGSTIGYKRMLENNTVAGTGYSELRVITCVLNPFISSNFLLYIFIIVYAAPEDHFSTNHQIAFPTIL